MAEDNLWGPIDMQEWQKTPCTTGRPATEKDVQEGRAVFYVAAPPGVVKAVDLGLPRCAIWNDEEGKRSLPVICIQAEQSETVVAVGFRFLDRGNGACLLSELTLLDGPDDGFA